MLTMMGMAVATLWGGSALVVIGTAALSRVLPQVKAILFEPSRPGTPGFSAVDNR